MLEVRGVIICGFPGVGKSTAAAGRSDIHDCESTGYKYPTTYNADGTITNNLKDENWCSNYVSDIIKLASQFGYSYVLASAHQEVRTELTCRGIPYIVVVPKKCCKDEYLSRYLKRGSDVAFIENINDNWNDWLDEIEREYAPVIHLSAGMTLSDILPPTANQLR